MDRIISDRRDENVNIDDPAFTVCWSCLSRCAPEIYWAVNHRPQSLVRLVPLSEQPCSYCPDEREGLSEA